MQSFAQQMLSAVRIHSCDFYGAGLSLSIGSACEWPGCKHKTCILGVKRGSNGQGDVLWSCCLVGLLC